MWDWHRAETPRRREVMRWALQDLTSPLKAPSQWQTGGPECSMGSCCVKDTVTKSEVLERLSPGPIDSATGWDSAGLRAYTGLRTTELPPVRAGALMITCRVQRTLDGHFSRGDTHSWNKGCPRSISTRCRRGKVCHKQINSLSEQIQHTLKEDCKI